MPYSFKLLVHQIKLQSTEAILIAKPILSIALANFPKLLVHGTQSISTNPTHINKAFSHGKSAYLNMDQERMEQILNEQPLELILMNEAKILAGARVQLQQFIPDIMGELKFKRGNFHLLDHAGKPYALADISISIHNAVSAPPKLNLEPPPDEIVYNNKNQQSQVAQPKVANVEVIKSVYTPKKQQQQKNNNKQTKYQNNIQQQSKVQPKAAPVVQRNTSVKQRQQRTISATSNRPQQPQQPQQQVNKPFYQKQQPQEHNIQVQPDISILEWANGNHCPPPMILDKKIYVHQIFNKEQEYIPTYIKSYQYQEIAIQTDMAIEQPQQPQQPPLQQQITRKLSNISDSYYQDDFESVSIMHSQSLQSMPIQPSQQQPAVKTPIATKQPILLTTHSIKELDEDAVSDIYSENFEEFSQSQTLRKSLSKKDDISDSYIPDFESISQSYNKKR